MATKKIGPSQDWIDDHVERLLLAVDDVTSAALAESNPDGHGAVDSKDALVACAVLARTAAIFTKGGP